MFICKCCKTEIPENSKFCYACGKEVEIVSNLVCPNPSCGNTDIPEFARFCPECGTEIKPKSQPVPAPAPQPVPAPAPQPVSDPESQPVPPPEPQPASAPEVQPTPKLIPDEKVSSVERQPGVPQIGDYYFSDGTFASQHIAGKRCVGVIFSLNTTEVEKGKGWTHGHIVALKDAELDVWREEKYGPFNLLSRMAIQRTTALKWGPLTQLPTPHNSYQEGISKKCRKDRDGYVYTNSGFVDGDEYEAFRAVAKFPAGLPKGQTSGWYVPTMGQMAELFENLGKVKINWSEVQKWEAGAGTSLIEKLNEYHLNIDQNGTYLTATEKNATNVWAWYISAFYLWDRYKSNYFNVRPIAAF